MTGPRFFPEALTEYEEAAAYYESCEAGLGARLVTELEEVIAYAMEYPGAPPTVKEAPAGYGLRWMLLASFPVKVIYAVRTDELVVVAVFHASRRPGYWLARLQRLGVR